MNEAGHHRAPKRLNQLKTYCNYFLLNPKAECRCTLCISHPKQLQKNNIKILQIGQYQIVFEFKLRNKFKIE